MPTTVKIIKNVPPMPLPLMYDVVVDDQSHQVFAYNKRIYTTPKEFEILRFLVARNGNTVSREEILKKVWGSKHQVGDTRTVDQHIARLRHHLGRAAANLVTVTNVGYRVTDLVGFKVPPPTSKAGEIRVIRRTFGENAYTEVTVRYPEALPTLLPRMMVKGLERVA